MNNIAATPQPAPTGTGIVIADLVLADIVQRVELGKERYGTPLRAYNGRDPLDDAYQEAIDLCFYLRQAIAERESL